MNGGLCARPSSSPDVIENGFEFARFLTFTPPPPPLVRLSRLLIPPYVGVRCWQRQMQGPGGEGGLPLGQISRASFHQRRGFGACVDVLGPAQVMGWKPLFAGSTDTAKRYAAFWSLFNFVGSSAAKALLSPLSTHPLWPDERLPQMSLTRSQFIHF